MKNKFFTRQICACGPKFAGYEKGMVTIMKCYEVIDKLEALSPISYAEDWDNVGLLAGRRDKEIKSRLRV